MSAWIAPLSGPTFLPLSADATLTAARQIAVRANAMSFFIGVCPFEWGGSVRCAHRAPRSFGACDGKVRVRSRSVRKSLEPSLDQGTRRSEYELRGFVIARN